MSNDSNTYKFSEFDPSGESTILRFPLPPDRAAELLREYVTTGHIPEIGLIDEIHILVSDAAIKRSYDEIPVPDELIDK